MGFPFNLNKRGIFDLVVAFLPPAISTGVRAVEAAITGSSSKKEKAVEIALGALTIFNGLPGFITDNPEFKARVEAINDAIVEAANFATKLAEAAEPSVGDGDAASPASSGPDGFPN